MPVPFIGDFMAGWLDNDRLALVDRTTRPWLLDVRDARGDKVGATTLSGTSPDKDGGFEGWDELTADHAAVDLVTGQTPQLSWLVSRYDLRDGRPLTTFSLQQPVHNCQRAEGAEIVTPTWTDGRYLSVQGTASDGSTRDVTTATRSLGAQCIELTQAAAGGTPRSPLLLDRLTDLISTRWEWCALGLLGLVVTAALLRRRRRSA